MVGTRRGFGLDGVSVFCIDLSEVVRQAYRLVSSVTTVLRMVGVCALRSILE